MSDRKITIDIESRGDAAPIEKAQAAVDNLSASQTKGGLAAKGAASASINAAKGFAALGQTAAASTGSVSAMASAIGNMSQQIPALAGAAGPIGLAIAAFMAWKSAIDAVLASQESLRKGLQDTAIGNIEASVNSMTAAYERLQKAIADAAEEARSAADAAAAREDAQTGSELAALDLERARRAAELDPADKQGLRSLDLDVAARRAEIADSAARRKADRELAALRAERSAAEASGTFADQQSSALQERFSELGGQYSAVNEHTTRRANQWWRSRLSSQRVMEGGQVELARIADEMKNVAAQIAQASEDSRAARLAAGGIQAREEAALIGRQSLMDTQLARAFGRVSDRRAYEFDAAAARREAEEKAAAEAAKKRADEEAAARAAAERALVSGELLSAKSGYASALAQRNRTARPSGLAPGGLAGLWGSDGRIRTSDDLAAEAGEAADAADRAVAAAAARLRAARERFERLESSVKNQRDND